VDIHLDIVGEPLERVLAAAPSLTRPLQKLPTNDQEEPVVTVARGQGRFFSAE
jgi:hypothetical protein